MYEPDYTEYSLNQLYDCKKHINSRKYPQRFSRLQKEIALRTERGEALTDRTINELFAVDVPLTLGFRSWWCFTWRSAAAGILLFALLTGLLKINAVFHLLPHFALPAMQFIYWIVVIPIAGTCIMMQVLAKRYSGYCVRIVRTPDKPN